MNNIHKNNEIAFDGNFWNYYVKEVDKKTYNIVYVKKTGFATAEEAAAHKLSDEAAFSKEMDKIRKSTGLKYTLSSYLVHWYETVLKSYAFGSYQSGCAWAIFDLIIPAIDEDPFLNAVTGHTIDKILEKLKSVCCSAPYSAKKILNIALNDAVADGLILRNPVVEAKTVENRTPHIVTYTKEELAKLLAAAKAYHSVYPEILMGIFLGLRTGEVFGLKISDFDFQEKTVEIKRQYTSTYDIQVDDATSYTILSRERVFKKPKSENSCRILRVPDFILSEVLNRYDEKDEMARTRKKYNKDWGEYFATSVYGTIQSANTLNNALKTICDRENIKKITFHQLRHIFASIMIEQGVPLEKISKMMGHKSIGTTFDIYCGIIEGKNQIRDFVEYNLDPMQSILNDKEAM